MLFLIVLISLPMALMNGCAMFRLNRDLTNYETLRQVSGLVENPDGDPSPVVLILWPEADDAELVSEYWVLGSEGNFSFTLPDSRYHLIAFRDENQDGHYQLNELAGMCEQPAILDSREDRELEDLRISLKSSEFITLPAALVDSGGSFGPQHIAWQGSEVESVRLLDDPLFDPEVAKDGYWTPLSFFIERGMHVHFLEPWDDKKVPVLFVHGVLGTPREFAALIAGLDRSRYQPWVVYYPSGIRLGELGDYLARIIDDLNSQYGFEHIDVVCHSMGGLVGLSALQNSGAGIKFDVPAFVSIATPWNGHAMAARGVKSAPTIVPSWYDMIPGNPFIETLISTPLPEGTEHYLFFAYEGKGGGLFGSENSDGTIALSSQLFDPAQDRAARVMGVDDSHVGVLSNPGTVSRLNAILSGTPAPSDRIDS